MPPPRALDAGLDGEMELLDNSAYRSLPEALAKGAIKFKADDPAAD